MKLYLWYNILPLVTAFLLQILPNLGLAPGHFEHNNARKMNFSPSPSLTHIIKFASRSDVLSPGLHLQKTTFKCRYWWILLYSLWFWICRPVLTTTHSYVTNMTELIWPDTLGRCNDFRIMCREERGEKNTCKPLWLRAVGVEFGSGHAYRIYRKMNQPHHTQSKLKECCPYIIFQWLTEGQVSQLERGKN